LTLTVFFIKVLTDGVLAGGVLLIEMDVARMKSFIPHLFSQMFVEMLVYGNVTKSVSRHLLIFSCQKLLFRSHFTSHHLHVLLHYLLMVFPVVLHIQASTFLSLYIATTNNRSVVA